MAEPLPVLGKVVSSDALNVREAASASSADLGDLTPGTVIEVLSYSADDRWARIAWQEGNAWVAARFLADVVRPSLDSGLPVGLTCAGTEPFWALTLTEAGDAVMQRPDGDMTSAITWSAPSRNVGETHYAFTTDAFAGVLQRGLCEDLAVDTQSGWSIDLILRGDTPGLLSGCCGVR